VVVATDPVAAQRLLAPAPGGPGSAPVSAPDARGSICLYFGIDGPPPVAAPTLVLNGDAGSDLSTEPGRLAVNNVCFPSSVAPGYAPKGKALASVTVVGTPGSAAATDAQVTLYPPYLGLLSVLI